MSIIDAATTLLDGVTRKKLDQVKDPKVREYLTNVWGDLLQKTPALFEALVGPGEVVLSGKHLEQTQKIMASLQDDILAFKNREIDERIFKDLVKRRKAAIFALYNAQKVTQGRPSVQKVLISISSIAEILLKHAVPFLLAAL
jgi:hypothetical protein